MNLLNYAEDSNDNLLDLLVNSVNEFVVFKDDTGRWLKANDLAEKLLQLENINYIGMTDIEIAEIVPEYGDLLRKCMETNAYIWETGKAYHGEEFVQHKDGKYTILAVSKIPVFHDDGSRKGLLMTAQDITEKKRSQALLEGQNHILEMMVKGEPLEKVLDELIKTVEKHCNQLICSILLVDDEGKRLLHGAAPSLSMDYNRQIDGIKIGPSAGSCGSAAYLKERVVVSNILEDSRWDGFRIPAMRHGLKSCWSTPIISHDGNVLGTFAMYYKQPKIPDDFSFDLIDKVIYLAKVCIERSRIEKKLHYISNYDHLTGLCNRNYFLEQMNKEIEKSHIDKRKLTLFHLDMDRFKYINETLGQEIGDKLLQEISHRLNQSADDTKIVSRIGGDEFLLLLPSMQTMEHSISIAKTLLQAIEQPYLLDGYELYITTSIGISIYPDDGRDSLTLLKSSEIALGRAKETGKNSYQIYSASMNAETFKKFELKNGLPRALKENEFFLHYQPRVNPKTNKIVNMEALIRWNHPTLGVVSPSEFIPLIEGSGLIVQVGEWVLRNACKQNKEWQLKGLPPLPISINFSVHQFMIQDFSDKIMQIINETGLDPKWIEVEITEETLIENKDKMAMLIKDLKKLGVKVCIDDFGTGYSSLHYLSQFEIDTLKIDKSFIHNMSGDVRVSKVMKAIISLAKDLEIQVVAEGVETHEQLNFLLKHSCNEVQGFLYCEPLPGKDIEDLLKKGVLPPKVIKTMNDVNRREYYRIQLIFPLFAHMTIAEYKGRKITVGKTGIAIEDIGLGGMRFTSNLSLSVTSEAVMEVTAEIMGHVFQLYGVIVWSQEANQEYYQYGLEYIVDEKGRDKLAKLLNEFSVRLKHNPLVEKCHFILEDKIKYLNNVSLTQ
jgi:diguanylate cyclase (GGDEF)-like protein/PAS domain S-box-containing protein